MMKRRAKFYSILLAGLLSFSAASSLYASYEQYYDQPHNESSAKVFLRGAGNAVGLPAEFVSTARRETDAHSRLWPVTYIPRAFNHMIVRLTSATNDIVFLPWVAPFVDDTGSWAEGIGLPRYPWQKE